MSDLAVHRLDQVPVAPLTPRQRLFCARIAGGASGTEAARQAGYAGSTAPQQASRLRRQPHVRQEIERLRQDAGQASQAALDRMLSKVERVFADAVRQHQCAAALHAVSMEAELRRDGARSLPDNVSPADLWDDSSAEGAVSPRLP